jgi:predicted dehydrogenase
MSKVAGQAGPRLRVLGSEGAFVAYGLDPQENALRAGELPGSSGWGRHPDARHAELCRGDNVTPIGLVPGDYGAFYRGVERAARSRTAPPVAVEEAAYVLDVLAAAATSARSGAVVPAPTGRGAGD